MVLGLDVRGIQADGLIARLQQAAMRGEALAPVLLPVILPWMAAAVAAGTVLGAALRSV